MDALAAVTAPTVAIRAAESGSLEGVHLDGIARAPVSDALVVIRPLLLTARTDEEGRFAFRNLPPGDYWLEIKVTDNLGKKTITRDVAFSVTGA